MSVRTERVRRVRVPLTVGIAAARCELAEALDVDLPGDGLERLLRDDRDLRRVLRRYRSVHSRRDPGLDTADRDLVFEAVARYVGATHWPCNFEEPEAGERFVAKVRAALETGIVVPAGRDPRRGRALALLRKERRMTIRDVARRSGLSHDTVRQAEFGTDLSDEVLSAVCVALRATSAYVEPFEKRRRP